MNVVMLRTILTCMAILPVSVSATAATCDSILGVLKKERQLTQVRQTEGKTTTEYQDGANITLSVSCGAGAPNLAITWDGPEPELKYYELVGRAGSLVSSRSAAGIVKASKQCRSQALKSDGETATVEEADLALECQAFVRDGGSTTISVFAE